MMSKPRLCCAMSALCMLLVSSPVHSGFIEHVWINTSGGAFDNTSNWDTNDVPNLFDIAVFNSPGESYTVSFNNHAEFMSLQVNNGEVTFDLDGHRLWLGDVIVSTGFPQAIIVGQMNGDDASLTLQDGEVHSFFTNVYIGEQAGSTGTLTLDLALDMTQWSTMFVGEDGNGTLNIQNASTLTTNGSGYVGYEQGTGNVTVSGDESMWTVTGSLNIGRNGTGTMEVTGGGTVDAQDAVLGELDGVGSVTVAGIGSTWTTTTLDIGENGEGILNITDGGTVDSGATTLGVNSGSEGSVTLGADATWTPDSLIIGDEGTGSLSMTNGASVTSGVATLGLKVDGIGTATVNGVGTVWETGTLNVGMSGQGTLNITNGGVVNSTSGRVGIVHGSTGAVTIDGTGSMWSIAGDLQLGGNAATVATGTASLTISDGGLFDVGGDLLVYDNASLDLTYGYTSNPTNAEKIVVGGEAVIEGESAIHMLKMDDGLIYTDDELVLIETTNGIEIDEEDITLTSGVYNPDFADNVEWTLEIRGNELVVIATVNDVQVATYAVGGHNHALAKAIDDAIGNGELNDDIRENLMALVQTSRLNSELRTLSPEPHRATAASTLRTTQMVNHAFSGEMAARRSGFSGMSQIASNTPSQHGASFADLANDPALFDYALGVLSVNEDEAAADSGWGGFARGIGVFDRVDGDDERTGYSANIGGFHAGVDRQVHRDWIIGLAGAYAYTDLKFRNSAGDGDIHTLRIGPYVSWTPEKVDGLFIDASASYGYHRHDMDRNIAVGSFTGTANGEYDAHDFSAYASVGYDFEITERTTLTPMVSAQYTYLHREGFTESGAPGANMDVDSASTDSLQTSLGVKLAHIVDLGDWTIVPEVSAAWGYEHLDRDTSVTARFDGTTSPFTISSSNLGRSSFQVAGGVSALISENLSGFMRYEGEFQSDRKTHAVVAGVAVRF